MTWPAYIDAAIFALAVLTIVSVVVSAREEARRL